MAGAVCAGESEFRSFPFSVSPQLSRGASARLLFLSLSQHQSRCWDCKASERSVGGREVRRGKLAAAQAAAGQGSARPWALAPVQSDPPRLLIILPLPSPPALRPSREGADPSAALAICGPRAGGPTPGQSGCPWPAGEVWKDLPGHDETLEPRF